ncbi:UNVERIFIED_CONTAM: hypothetical protein K2H54_037605 [Gekko kuhli]
MQTSGGDPASVVLRSPSLTKWLKDSRKTSQHHLFKTFPSFHPTWYINNFMGSTSSVSVYSCSTVSFGTGLFMLFLKTAASGTAHVLEGEVEVTIKLNRFVLKDLILDCESILDAHQAQAQPLGLGITDMHKQRGFQNVREKAKGRPKTESYV